ncbi:anti-sigma factor antagonist [Desulfovibrio aerotolerans]|uniref:Anti-sigma factor antagonist n=1 Tax=Solidesulfovibrio aerotolerans TaxID=295255 RepID=A0A7C9IUY2_9BACT|nr:anti-sigma factor antagonist [Solidesulfovibrio aerotolerans]
MENLTIRREGGALLLKYAGEITLEMTGDLKRRLDRELGEGDVAVVVIDLSAVPFMDSSGIGLLVSVNTRMKSAGKAFYLYQLSPAVEKTLGLVQLIGFFTVLPDQAALAGVCG